MPGSGIAGSRGWVRRRHVRAIAESLFALLFNLTAAILTLSAPVIIQFKRDTPTGFCCLAIGWQFAVLDAVLWLNLPFRVLGGLRATGIYGPVVTSLFSLIIPLVALAATCVLPQQPARVLPWSTRILVASCCIVLLDLLMLIFVVSEFAQAVARAGFAIATELRPILLQKLA